MTVLVTLHQVDYALRYCDRVVALKAGGIAYDGLPRPGLGHDTLVGISMALSFRTPSGKERRHDHPSSNWPRWAAAHLSLAGCGRQGWPRRRKPRPAGRAAIFRAVDGVDPGDVGQYWQPILADMQKQTGLKIHSIFTPIIIRCWWKPCASRKPTRGGFPISRVSRRCAGAAARCLRAHSAQTASTATHRVLIVNAKSHLTLDKVLACNKDA